MSYEIPAGTARTEIEIKRSRFIATVGFADTPEKAREFIEAVRTEMPDANHHVYAFRVGFGATIVEGMSDDGEPSGTSGPPTLAILRGSNLGDIVIVTARYFGGTKLGTGGLVRAYSEAARAALDVLTTEVKIEKIRVLVEVAYTHFNTVKQLIEAADGEISQEKFTTDVLLEFMLPKAHLTTLQADITNATAGSAEILVV